jgi:plastocyanin
MKNIFFPLVLIGTATLIFGCKKTDTASEASLSSEPIANITFSTATGGGNISSDGNAPVTARGVCWNTSPGPNTSDSKTSDGNGTGPYISDLTGLIAGTTYFVRAYATNSAGTAYGEEIAFSTNPLQPAVLTTSSANAITVSTAVSGGNITTDNGSAVTARGVCWNITGSPAVAGSHTSDGTGIGSFVSNLTGLLDGTQYFVRAYATNGSGTAYGNEVTFTTASIPAGNEILIQDMAFAPRTLTIPVNSTVKWTNQDGISHTVTSDSGAWDSGNISSGSVFSFIFTSTGTFHYHCTYHPMMTGTIIVQ